MIEHNKAIAYKEIPSPCYVLEESKLIRNLELIDSVQQRAGITIILALKGFAMFSAFPVINKYLKGTINCIPKNKQTTKNIFL